MRTLRIAGILLLLATSVLCSAQNTATLQGSIADTTGAVLPKAEVTATNGADGSSRSVTAGADGSYIFTQMKPGSYSVKARLTGFDTAVQNKVELLVATPTTLNFRLKVGNVSETVEVTGETPLINTADASVGNAFDQMQVKMLPFAARNPINLLTLQPGVVTTGQSDTDLLFQGSAAQLDDREGVVNGVRGNQSNVTLDGVDSNNWETQAAFSSAMPVTLDSLQEFRVITTNANPTEGASGGAQVALVTKSGTNAFHGNLRYYYRTDATSARDWFIAHKDASTPKLIRNIGGASLGGPLKKDRAYFFLDYELRKEASEQIANRLIPTENLKQGILTYRDINGGIHNLTPADIQGLDPAHIGVDPAMLAYLKQFPVGNDVTASPDGGLAQTGFTFNAPQATDNNIYTARFDFNLTQKQTLFARGTLGDIKTDLTGGQFPGAPPNSTLLNNSKGLSIGYTMQISPALINTAHYGISRLGIESTGASGASFRLRGFDNLINTSRAVQRQIPTNEVADDVSWTRGSHTLQGGASVRFIRSRRVSNGNAFPDFLINDGFCVNLCTDAFRAIVNKDPNAEPEDRTLFDRSFMALIGAVTQTSATFFVDPKNGTFLPAGTTPVRHFAENDAEGYLQDTWRIRNNLTLTYGVRYSYYTPVWETNGLQIRPTQDVRTWFAQRATDMFAGRPADAAPLLSFELAGKANNAEPWWNPDTNNIAPRVGFAYSPGFDSGIGKWLFGGPGRTSIRLGAGIYYSRVGGAIAADTDINGSFGLSDSLINGAGQFTMATAPRFGGSCNAISCSNLPPLGSFITPPAAPSFPAVPGSDFSNLGFLVDNRLSTPYSTNVNFGIQRDLGKGFVADVGYVGTFGRQLLTKTDISQNYGLLKDPTSGQTLWGAYNQIVGIIGKDPFHPVVDPNNAAALAGIKNIAFFQNMLPNLPSYLGLNGLTPTQAFYVLATAFAPDWGDALAFGFDTVGGGSPWNSAIDPQQDGFVLYQPQFQSLPAWLNWGSSNYHSLQLGLRKRGGSLNFGVNYVFSKSIDNGSTAENADLFSLSGLGALTGQIPNAFIPSANRAVSDFDLRHNFNAYYVYDLPFGRGKRFGGDSHLLLDEVIGGWSLTGTWRWRSGFPLSPGNGFNFPTNFELTPPGTLVGPLDSSVTRKDANGEPNLFRDPSAAQAMIGFTPPGGSGSRNVFRGPAYVDTDMGVYKSFRMPWSEKHTLQFRWTAFNLFNNLNLSDNSIGALDPDSGSNFGRFQATASPARRGGGREMEFALRYEF